MSLNIEDAESAYLKGKAWFDEWKDEHEMNWYKPQIIDLMGTMLNTMPLQGRIMAPEATAQIERIYRQQRGG